MASLISLGVMGASLPSITFTINPDANPPKIPEFFLEFGDL
ncbi:MULTISPECIES: hypothetical protein [unclassified Nostoc]|nr:MULTISPECIES: hypothetical protein [unclassified Nostoc]